MTNDEGMTHDEGITKFEGMTQFESRMARVTSILGWIGDGRGFDIRHSDFFSHSSFTAELERMTAQCD